MRASATYAKQPSVQVLEILLGSLRKPFQGLGLRMLLQKSRVVDDDPYQCLRQIFGSMPFSFLLPPPTSQRMPSTIPVILDDLEFLGRQPEMPTRWPTYRLGQQGS